MDEMINELKKETEKQEEVSTLRKRFTKEEDRILKYVIQTLGIHNWSEVSKYLPNRTSRQCRDRYNNYLFKDITIHPWTEEEDAIILGKYLLYGNHWAKISTYLDGRSGNNVKNRWHKYLSKRYSSYLSKKKFSYLQNPQPYEVYNPVQIQPIQPVQILNNCPNNQSIVYITYLFNQQPYLNI